MLESIQHRLVSGPGKFADDLDVALDIEMLAVIRGNVDEDGRGFRRRDDRPGTVLLDGSFRGWLDFAFSRAPAIVNLNRDRDFCLAARLDLDGHFFILRLLRNLELGAPPRRAHHTDRNRTRGCSSGREAAVVERRSGLSWVSGRLGLPCRGRAKWVVSIRNRRERKPRLASRRPLKPLLVQQTLETKGLVCEVSPEMFYDRDLELFLCQSSRINVAIKPQANLAIGPDEPFSRDRPARQCIEYFDDDQIGRLDHIR